MSGTRQVIRFFWTALGVSLGVCGLLYFPLTWHWPLVGDASLIHYIAFLIGRGWAPYRQLGDMNMPGSYLVELAAMHVFGPGALAWRLFDFAVCLGGGVAMLAACGRRKWQAALLAASLFVLIHGRDGLAQGGQRDLTMAVCLLAATACLLAVARRGSAAAAAGFGVLSGLAVTIKPTAVLLTLLQTAILWSATTPERKRWPPGRMRYLVGAAGGWLIAPALCIAFLVREHSLGAFVAGFRGIVPYYATLGHRPLLYVLTHSLSPIEPLVALWLIELLLRRHSWRVYLDLPHRLLLAGVLFGLVNCIVQHRALPYYRYPLLAFLLPVIALDLFAAAKEWVGAGNSYEAESASVTGNVARPAGRAAGVVALAGLTFAGFFLAPQSAVLISRYRWYQTEMLDSLEHNLQTLGGAALSGRVQCIDSVSGCGTVLYRMRLEPATGILSDFLLFGNTTDALPPEEIPIIRETRAELLAKIQSRAPEVMVVTSHLHMTGPEDYGKLARWPELERILATRYTLAEDWRPARRERWWSREEYPAGYRIYVLRNKDVER